MTFDDQRLTGAEKTALLTLYGKALDARSSDPILGDTMADQAVRAMDFDFKSLKLPSGAATSLPVRAKHLDDWNREFLAAHPKSTVLHLGCGLDTRVYRVDPPAGARWYDVDLPAVIELRQELYPPRADYELVGASVIDPTWLHRIAGDRPVLVVAEGLVMHVPTAELVALFRRITEKFPSGQVVLDVYSASTARFIMWSSRFGRTRVNLHWGLPAALKREVPTLHLIDSVPYLTLPDLVSRLGRSAFSRAYFCAVAAGFMRNSMLHLRYQFN